MPRNARAVPPLAVLSAMTSTARSAVVTAALLAAFLFVPTSHAASFQVDTSSTLTTSLLSYYQEEDGDDAHGTYDTTAVNGPLTYNTGKINNAVDLNGSNQAQKVTSDPFNFDYTQPFSMSWWFKMDATNVYYFLFNKKDSSPGAGWAFTYYGPSAIWEFYMRNPSQEMYRDMTLSSPNTNWHHGLFTYDGSGNPSGVHFYIDNSELSGSNTGSVSSSTTGGSVDFHIGSNLNDGVPHANFFNGHLDEVGIWTKVLSSQERSDLYNSGNGNPFTPSSFYAQIKSTDTLSLRQDADTSAAILKTLPGDWVVYVSSTMSATGTPIVNDGYRWFNVADKTDSVNGWMAATSTTDTFLSYVTSTSQSTFENMASIILSASSTRAEKIVEAVNHYWDNVASTDSLYYTGFPYLFSPTSSVSSTWKFPKELFYAIASQESGGGGSNSFNNQIVTFDYGHGITQLTPYQVWSHEPTSTGGWIDNTENVPTYGSHITIAPCAMIATTTYINCYTEGGTGSGNAKPYKDYGYSNVSTTYKFYTNTSQSVYANIKDGLTVLKNKYNHTASSTATVSSTVFQSYEREWLRATWGYNGIDLESDYLSDVATKMDMFSDYYSSTGTRMVATSSFTVDLASKLRIADDYKEEVVVFSPVELSIIDSLGRVTGVMNEEIKEEIPDSVYNPQRKAIAVFFSNDAYTYNVKGVGNGTYGLLIDHPVVGSKINIYAPAVPIKVGEVHTYAIDWGMVARGGNGVAVSIDNDGDGIVDSEVSTDKLLTDLTLFTAPTPIEASIFLQREDAQRACFDGVDNDNDGAIDLADFDCRSFMPPTPPVYVSPPVIVVSSSTSIVVSSSTNSTQTVNE